MSFTVVYVGLGRAWRISMTWCRIAVPIAVRVVPAFRRVIPSATSMMVVSPVSTFLVRSGVVIRAPLVRRSWMLVVWATMIRGSVVCSRVVGGVIRRSVTVRIVVSMTVVVSGKEEIKCLCVKSSKSKLPRNVNKFTKHFAINKMAKYLIIGN